jgi:hypothetical protein
MPAPQLLQIQQARLRVRGQGATLGPRRMKRIAALQTSRRSAAVVFTVHSAKGEPNERINIVAVLLEQLLQLCFVAFHLRTSASPASPHCPYQDLIRFQFSVPLVAIVHRTTVVVLCDRTSYYCCRFVSCCVDSATP